MLKLTSSHHTSLLAQPESGMGYQLVEVTTQDNKTKRGVAYNADNDHRVTPSGGLLPASYATTEEDARSVRTGREAVRRYALPNPKPAVYVFTVKPPKDTEVQRGTVQPAHGQPGGGAEAIFSTGTPEKTVTGPDTIPEGGI